jgi:Ca2+-binding EF-hand superfamily protein
MIDVKEEVSVSFEEATLFLKEVVEKISTRFTKKYFPPSDDPNIISNTRYDPEKFFLIPVEFFEPKIKTPVPIQKVRILFQVPKSLHHSDVSFIIENEEVFYPLYESIDLSYFETLLDRVLLNKDKSSKIIYLHTNFEETRIISLQGEKKKLFTIEEEENIFTNNNSEFFLSDSQAYPVLEIEKIDKFIKLLWKTLKSLNSNSETVNFEEFKILFDYGKLNFSPENIQKLWKYTDKRKKNEINYQEFLQFCMDLIQCLRAYHVAVNKNENNQYINNKIKTCVEVMEQHFKEYDHEGNQEISFDNLKKCLAKENDLFSRQEIEIILKQISPHKNFEYWKFDKILRILYVNNFNYNELMKEDKIYKYLITIAGKQDTYSTGKLHYKKLKHAFLIEEKLKLNKTQIMIILNFFNINKNPEIDYFKAGLIIRDIIQELFSADMSMQKIDITSSNYQTFETFEDVYDGYIKGLKDIFINFDKDFDHLLNKEEFKEFLHWLIPYIKEDNDKNLSLKQEIFDFTDNNKDGKINFQEFKLNFPNLMHMTRIKNVMKEISDIY